MEAFATYQDLGLRLNRDYTADEQAWITSLLEDASAYLREDVIGQQVFPRATSTFTAYPSGGWVDLPASPVVAVVSVVRSGVAVPFIQRDNAIQVDATGSDTSQQGCDAPVSVTFTYGYATAPESLKRWTMVLVSQALIPLELKLGLTAGGLSSVAIDDFKASWANAGEDSGMSLSTMNIERLRAQYGVGVYIQGTR